MVDVGTPTPSSSRISERSFVVNVTRRNICTAIGGEFESVECNTICRFDSAAAYPELRSNFVVRVICKTTQYEYEPAKHIQASMNSLGVFH